MSDLFRWCSRYYCECSKEGIEKQKKTSGIDKSPCTTADTRKYCVYRDTKYPEEEYKR